MALRSKNAHHGIYDIRARHWRDLAMKNGGPAVWAAMLGLAGQVGPALNAVEAKLPGNFPDRIWTPVADGMRGQAQKFQAEVAGLS